LLLWGLTERTNTIIVDVDKNMTFVVILEFRSIVKNNALHIYPGETSQSRQKVFVRVTVGWVGRHMTETGCCPGGSVGPRTDPSTFA